MEEKEEHGFVKKLESFVTQRHRLILFAIIIFAFFVRLYYMTANAALWWDEADYLTLAKHFGLGLPEQAAPWRARGMTILLGVFYWFGANEWVIRLLEAIASTAGVFFTYKLGELYNKRVGLIAALGMAFYFEYLFWSARIAMDIYAVVICTSAMWLFWKGYMVKNSWKYTAGAGALLGFGPFAYESTAFMFIIIVTFLIITERFSFLKKKTLWAFIIAALIVATPFMIYNQVTLGSIYPRAMHQVRHIETPGESGTESWNPTASDLISKLFYYPKSFIYMMGGGNIGYLGFPLFIAFLIGLGMFANMLMGFDLFFKGRGEPIKKDLFFFLWAVTVVVIFSVVYAFTIAFEPGIRFLFPMMPVAFIIMAKGIETIYRFIKKYNAEIAVVAISAILLFGVYSHLAFADKLINSKKDSFRAQHEGGVWMKEHLAPNEPLVGCGMAVPLIYYSERQMIGFGDDTKLADEVIIKHRPMYVIIDGFDPACQRVNYAAMHPEIFRPVQAFFIDSARTQPIVIIYEANYPQNASVRN